MLNWAKVTGYEAEIIYWLVPQPANGVVSLVCLEANGRPKLVVMWLSLALSGRQAWISDPVRYLDIKGWTPSQAKFEPCDVGEIAGHYAYGSWRLGCSHG